MPVLQMQQFLTHWFVVGAFQGFELENIFVECNFVEEDKDFVLKASCDQFTSHWSLYIKSGPVDRN